LPSSGQAYIANATLADLGEDEYVTVECTRSSIDKTVG
jgi:hypothetical protein